MNRVLISKRIPGFETREYFPYNKLVLCRLACNIATPTHLSISLGF